MSQHVTCGLVDCILTYQILNKNSASQLTQETFTILDQVNLELQLTVGRVKFAIVIETKSDTSFNSFLAIREQTSQKSAIKFSIYKVISNINNTDVNYLELGDELKYINNDNNIRFKIEQAGGNGLIRGGSKGENRGQNKR